MNLLNGKVMKKVLTGVAAASVALSASAQEKGRFEAYDLKGFKLHVYYTNDPMADASYIVEGNDSLITLEQPLFKDNVAEYDAKLSALGKPVIARITDYHLGGTDGHETYRAAGMPKFMSEGAYAAMMKGFAQNFGDAIVPLPDGKTDEVPFGATEVWDNIPFKFNHGATTDFPGASILIGGQVYFTHWAPMKAHMSHLQITSPAAIDGELAEARKSLESGASLFIGGHGGAAHKDAVEFKIDYLTTMKQALADNKTEDGFIAAMKKAYPGLAGENNLPELAKTLYKK